MFKVGEFVKIKRFAEIKKIDRKLYLNIPDPCIAKHYCGKIGRVTKVEQSSNSNGEIYVIRLNITRDFAWYDVELTSYCNNFIPLQICLS